MTEQQIRPKLAYPLDENLEPDHSKKKRKGDMWCPYCGEWRKFKSGMSFNKISEITGSGMKSEYSSSYRRCEVCTISEEDYYFKKANKTWGMPNVKSPERR